MVDIEGKTKNKMEKVVRDYSRREAWYEGVPYNLGMAWVLLAPPPLTHPPPPPFLATILVVDP